MEIEDTSQIDKVLAEFEAQGKDVPVDPELTVNDDVHEMTEAENKAKVAKATGSKPKKESTPKEPKEKAPTTSQVAAAWIAAQDLPLSKAELNALALKTNPKRYGTKDIVRLKKVGVYCPANKAGAYIAEGLDFSRNGGVKFELDSDKKVIAG